MTRNVRQVRRKGKDIGMVPVPATVAPDLDTRVALIQALIPVALERVHQELKDDVARLAGEWYAREGRQVGHVRWTRQRGSIYLADQKIRNSSGGEPLQQQGRGGLTATVTANGGTQIREHVELLTLTGARHRE